MFVPGGQTFLTHRREGGQTILTHRRGTNIFKQRGGQTFYVGGSGGYDDVYEVMDISEVNLFANSMSPSH